MGLLTLLMVLQLIPVDRTNPPLNTGEDLLYSRMVSQEMQTLVKTACYDCHSNETNYPWYARIAPVSFILHHHVREGREHLNFSEWDKLNQKRKMKRLEEIVEEVEEGKMPMPIYLIMHGDAEVSAAELAVLREWTQQELGKLGGADMGNSNDSEEAHEEEH